MITNKWIRGFFVPRKLQRLIDTTRSKNTLLVMRKYMRNYPHPVRKFTLPKRKQ